MNQFDDNDVNAIVLGNGNMIVELRVQIYCPLSMFVIMHAAPLKTTTFGHILTQ